jgi:hypothetical protein
MTALSSALVLALPLRIVSGTRARTSSGGAAAKAGYWLCSCAMRARRFDERSSVDGLIVGGFLNMVCSGA